MAGVRVHRVQPPVLREHHHAVCSAIQGEAFRRSAVEGRRPILIAAAESVHKPLVQGQAFNFSNESYVTVRQIVEAIADVMQIADLPPIILGQAAHEILSQSLSAEKARTVLGWNPTFSLHQGLEQTVQWYRLYLGMAS